jgi:hypothetical protein
MQVLFETSTFSMAIDTFLAGDLRSRQIQNARNAAARSAARTTKKVPISEPSPTYSSPSSVRNADNSRRSQRVSHFFEYTK